MRAIWRGKTDEPRPGAQGLAWPAPGYGDPESAEYGAYLFQPSGERLVAYYCRPERDLTAMSGDAFVPRRVEIRVEVEGGQRPSPRALKQMLRLVKRACGEPRETSVAIERDEPLVFAKLRLPRAPLAREASRER